MKTIEEIMKDGNICRATVYKRLKKIEEIIGETEKEYQKGKSNDDRIFTDDIASMIVSYQGQKPGRKPRLTKEDVEGVLKS